MGALLFETLTGRAPAQGRPDRRHRRPAWPRRGCRAPPPTTTRCPSPSRRSCSARWPPIPPPATREIQEMRKAVDTLLFSGDFTPDHLQPRLLHALAVPRGHRAGGQGLKEEKDASYVEYLADEPVAAPGRRGSPPGRGGRRPAASRRASAWRACRLVAAEGRTLRARRSRPRPWPSAGPAAGPVTSAATRRATPAVTSAARRRAGFTFHRAAGRAASRRRGALGGGGPPRCCCRRRGPATEPARPRRRLPRPRCCPPPPR